MKSLIELTSDLKYAHAKAKEAALAVEDKGSCNLDSVFLRIPRIRETSVLQAIKDAGLYCRKKREWIGQGYMITPQTSGQAYKRELAVEVMAKTLRVLGWDVISYQQMD